VPVAVEQIPFGARHIRIANQAGKDRKCLFGIARSRILQSSELCQPPHHAGVDATAGDFDRLVGIGLPVVAKLEVRVEVIVLPLARCSAARRQPLRLRLPLLRR
jgi:hypothetical protein